MNTIIEELKKNQNVRSNLSKLRQCIKNEESKAQCISELRGYAELFVRFLKDEDPKTRKNAALLLGDLECQEAMGPIWETFRKEGTEFVKGSYLEALSKLDTSEIIEELLQVLKELTETEETEENRKHVQEQLRALRKIQIAHEGITKHRFCNHPGTEVILTCNREQRDTLRKSISTGRVSTHPLGILVETDEIGSILSIRTYRELLFPIHTGHLLEPEPRELAKELWESDFYKLLCDLHREPGPFYFRIECKNQMTLEERSAFSRKLSGELERLSKGALVNSTTDYEVELRLVANKEGKLLPCMKLYTIKNKRFAYRKNAIAASIHPATAALMMELAEPYLKEKAQIMDPFCGVGTMLIERNKKLPAREMYATDIFGEAIEKGRENALLAGADIHFIHRDFFDFKHNYLFDEIITNMPVKGKRSKEEMDSLYSDFFEKVGIHLNPDAVIIMYTNELAFVKKQLRLHKEFRLLEEHLMQKKNEFYLLIIGVRGE